MNLGENIYKFRTQKNLSQGDLANALDVSRQSVSKWENNNAVPELDKLMKMAKIFGVTLDELTGMSDQAETIPAPAQPIIIQQNFRPLSLPKILGIVFFCIGLLFLPMALSAVSYKPMFTCFILCGMFILFGISFLSVPYRWLPCGWAALAALSVYVFHLTHWETNYPALIAIGLLLAAMLWWTIAAHKRGRIRIPAWLWWIGGLVLIGLLILFCMNFVPPFWICSSYSPVFPG